MSQRHTALVGGLFVALATNFCATSYAVVPYIQVPYVRHSPTVSYGTGPGDYQSRPDIYGVSSTPGQNDLAGTNSYVSAPSPTGLGNTTVGIGELVTPLAGSTLGAPNDHAFKVNTITLPLAGQTTAPLTVKLEILAGFLSNGDGVTPVPPNDFNTNDTFVQQSTLFTDTFVWDNPGGTSPSGNDWMTTFDLSNTNITFNLGQTYLIGFKWSNPQNINQNAFLLDRGSQDDPGGQKLGYTGPNPGGDWGTRAFGGFNPRTAAIAINVPVPEPASLALLSLALPALFCAARRRNLKAASPRRAKLGHNPMTD